MSTRKLEFATRLTREDVAGLIEALIEGLKDGMLKVQKSGETLELEVPRVVDLEIEAEINDERAEFEIEVSWRTNRAENPDTPPAGAQPNDGARASLAEAARKLDATAKKAAGAMEKVAARKTARGAAGTAVKQAKRQPGKKDAAGKKPRSAKE